MVLHIVELQKKLKIKRTGLQLIFKISQRVEFPDSDLRSLLIYILAYKLSVTDYTRAKKLPAYDHLNAMVNSVP